MTGTISSPARIPVQTPGPGAEQQQSTALIGFRRHLHAEVVEGDAAYVFSERGVTALKGALVEALAPLLDGTRDLAAVLREMPAGTSKGQLEDLIRRLTVAGLVAGRLAAETGAGAGVDEPALAYWDNAGLDPAGAAERTAAARVALISVGSLGTATADRTTDATAAALAAAGIGLSGAQQPADLSVVLCDDYLAPGLARIDATHRAAGRPWLLAKPGGGTVWIGPVFQPGLGCWHCLASRLREHRPAESWVQTALGRTGPAARAAVTVPPLASAAAALITLEVTKWLAGLRHPGQQAVWTFDSLDLGGRHHQLRARPQCPECGDPVLGRATAGRPVVLTPRPKSGHTDGGHRWLTPEQVLDRYRHLISPVTGVVKDVTRDKRGPAFFTNFRSGANQASGVRTLQGLRSAVRVENGGKGTTPIQAEVGALCEALERYSGNYRGDEARITGSLRSLGEQAVHPNACMLYDDRQYAERSVWNTRHSAFQQVCAPFDEDAELDWSPVWSLTGRRVRLLPTALLYFNTPPGPGRRSVRADSNGNAAGSCLEDAILQGVLEVVERDAVALWWYNRTRAPGIDLDAFGDPWIRELRSVYAGLEREVWALDVTADLGIPTVVALSRRTGGGPGGEGIMVGFGAHLDPGVAVRRALSEMNQLVPCMVRLGATGTVECPDDPDADLWLRTATLASQPWLVPDPDRPARGPGDFGYLPSTDLTADVRVVQARLEAAGLEVMVLDQTRPDIGLPVVKVIVPGMRHFWARYAPGRLFDVPVRLGRLAAPTPYDQLNPIPLFL